MVGSALALLYWGRDQTIRGDELGYAARLASQPFDHAVLHSPPNKYFIALPLLVYHALVRCLRPRGRPPVQARGAPRSCCSARASSSCWRAAASATCSPSPTVLLLFFGSGWETVITPVRMPSLMRCRRQGSGP